MKKEKLIKVLDFIGDLLEDNNTVGLVNRVKEESGTKIEEEIKPDLFIGGDRSLEIIDKIETINKNDELMNDINSNKLFNRLLNSILQSEIDGNLFNVYGFCQDNNIKDNKTQHILRVKAKNIMDTFNLLRKRGLIDEQELNIIKETEKNLDFSNFVNMVDEINDLSNENPPQMSRGSKINVVEDENGNLKTTIDLSETANITPDNNIGMDEVIPKIDTENKEE